jgi:hypothetical protein
MASACASIWNLLPDGSRLILAPSQACDHSLSVTVYNCSTTPPSQATSPPRSISATAYTSWGTHYTPEPLTLLFWLPSQECKVPKASIPICFPHQCMSRAWKNVWYTAGTQLSYSMNEKKDAKGGNEGALAPKAYGNCLFRSWVWIPALPHSAIYPNLRFLIYSTHTCFTGL